MTSIILICIVSLIVGAIAGAYAAILLVGIIIEPAHKAMQETKRNSLAKDNDQPTDILKKIDSALVQIHEHLKTTA